MHCIILNFNWDPKSAQLMRPLWSQVSCVSFHGLCLAQCAMKDLLHIEPPFVISDYEAVLNYQPNHQGRVSDVHQPCLVSSLPSHSPVTRLKFPLNLSTLCIVTRLKFPVHFPTLCIVHFVFSLEWKIHTDFSTLFLPSEWKISTEFFNTLYCHQTENFLNTSFRACTVRCQWRRPVLSHLQCTMCWPRFSKMTDVSSSHLPVVPKDDRCLGSVGSSSLLSPFPARAWSSSALHVFGFLCYCRVSEFYIGWSSIFRCTYNLYLFKVLKEN